MPDTNKTFKTRIQLKYDTYANWTAKDPVLLAGEMAIATIASGNTQEVNSVKAPQVIIKIGDGVTSYNDLKFVSALAADVHEWAKAEKLDFKKIEGLTNFISENERDTEYRIVKVPASTDSSVNTTYQYKLQSKGYNEGDEAWVDVTGSLIDLSEVDDRLDKAEASITSIKADIESLTGSAEGVAGQIEEKLKAITVAPVEIGESNTLVSLGQNEGGTIDITDSKVVPIKISESQVTNLTDDLATKATKTELNTAKTELQTSINANTTAINTLNDKATNPESVAGQIDTKVETLNAADPTNDGTATGATVAVVSGVDEEKGIITVHTKDIQFNTALSAENKAATMSDVSDEIDKVMLQVNGAMHFAGIADGNPVAKDENENFIPFTINGTTYNPVNGDVVIFNSAEYVYVSTGTAKGWHLLGDEGYLAETIATMALNEVTVGADSTLTKISQANGKVEAEATKIQIAESQVTNLTKDLEAKAAKSELATTNDNVTAVKERVDLLEKDEPLTEGTIAYKIQKAFDALSEDPINSVGSENVKVKIEQSKGNVTGATVTVTGLATSASVTDLETKVNNVKTTVDTNKTDIDTLKKGEAVTGSIANIVKGKIDGLTATVNANADSNKPSLITTPTGNFNVLTMVQQTSGTIAQSESKAVTLHKVAATGKINDLDQTGDYIIFNCGTATDVMPAT